MLADDIVNTEAARLALDETAAALAGCGCAPWDRVVDLGPRSVGAMTTNDSADMVDWDLAVATARRLAKPGPAVTTEEARRVVEDLKTFAAEASEPVRRSPVCVRRPHSTGRGGGSRRLGPGERGRHAEIITPLADKLRARRSSSGLMDQVGPRSPASRPVHCWPFLLRRCWASSTRSGPTHPVPEPVRRDVCCSSHPTSST